MWPEGEGIFDLRFLIGDTSINFSVMPVIENPAFKAFVAQMGDELTLAQVLIRRAGAGYELRHVEDRVAASESVRAVRPSEARALAQFTAAGEFRPLKAAPGDLIPGQCGLGGSAAATAGAFGLISSFQAVSPCR